MKKFFFLPILLSFLCVQAHALGIYDPYLDQIDIYDDDSFSEQVPEEENCQAQGSLSPIEDLLGKDIPKRCDIEEKEKAKYCNCLEEKKNQNILLIDLVKSKDKDQKEMREHYTNKFFDSYSQMVLEDTVQEHILNEKDSGSHVNCTPEEMDQKVNVATDAHLEAQHRLLDKKQTELNSIVGACDEGKWMLHFRVLNKEFCNDSSEQLALVKKRLEDWPQTILKTHDSVNDGLDCGQDSMNKVLADLSKLDPKDENVINFKKALNEKEPPETSGKQPQSGDYCSLEKSELLTKADDYFKKKMKSISESPVECGTQLECKFKEYNDQIANKLANDYKFDENVDCVSFAEFRTFNSIPPGGKFLKELENDPLKFLSTVPVKPDNDLYKAKMKFLRTNPMLAKAIQHPNGNTAKLESLLKKLASDLKNKTDPQKLKIYLDFLKDKDGLQSIIKSDVGKTNELKVCSDLARNYTAIILADYLPTSNEDNPNLDKRLKRELRKCRRNQGMSKDPNNALATLKVDPVFNLGNEDRKEADKNERDQYNKFLLDNCHTLPEKESYESFMKKCSTSKDKKICREEFLKKSPFAPIREVTSGYPLNTDDGLGSDPVGTITDPLKDENQDQEFVEWFNQSVLPTYYKDPMGVFGMNSYLNNRSTGHSFQGSTPAPRSSSKSSGSSVASTSSPTRGPASFNPNQGSQSVNPGQVMPRFKSPSRANAAAEGEVGSNRAPASASNDPVRKNSYSAPRNNQTYSPATSSLPKEGSGVSEEELAEDLAENEERSKKLGNMNTTNEKSKASPSRGVSMNSSFSPSPSSMVAPGAGNLPGPNRGPTALGPSPYKKGTFNDALNSIHDKAAMSVLGGSVDPKEFTGPQQSAKDLIVDDPIKFEKLGEDPVLLEAFIKEKMKGMVVGESKIITIINASPNRPVPHMIFRIKAKEDGSFEIQSVPSEVPVRVATLKSLIDQLPKK